MPPNYSPLHLSSEVEPQRPHDVPNLEVVSSNDGHYFDVGVRYSEAEYSLELATLEKPCVSAVSTVKELTVALDSNARVNECAYVDGGEPDGFATNCAISMQIRSTEAYSVKMNVFYV